MKRRTRRRLLLAIGLIVLVSLAGIGILPWLLAHSAWGQRFVTDRLFQEPVDVSVDQVSLNWWRPAVLETVAVADVDQRWTLSMDRAHSDLNLWRLFWSGHDLGSFTLVRPTVVLNTYQAWPERKARLPEKQRPKRKLRLVVQQAAILVRTIPDATPLPLATEVSAKVDYLQEDETRWLHVLPGRPLQHTPLTAPMCDLALKYAVPVLANVSWTEGSISLELERCQIPLHSPDQTELKAVLSIHSVRSGLRDQFAYSLERFVQKFRPDFPLPSSVRIADETDVQVTMEQGIVHHEGLRFGLPDVADDLLIETRGDVHLDKTLDLAATVPLGGSLLGARPFAEALQGRSLRVEVGGTLDDPQFSLGQSAFANGSLIGDMGKELLEDEETVDKVLDGLRRFRQRRLRQRLERSR